jgi:hypothetical protein
VINFESVSTFSYYLENFVNEKSMVMQLWGYLKLYPIEIIKNNNNDNDNIIRNNFAFNEVLDYGLIQLNFLLIYL